MDINDFSILCGAIVVTCALVSIVSVYLEWRHLNKLIAEREERDR